LDACFWAHVREREGNYFLCTIREFSLSQKVSGEAAPSQAFQLREMGPTGTGRLEEGDANGEIFWIKYPLPFLQYFYATFPLSTEEQAPLGIINISLL